MTAWCGRYHPTWKLGTSLGAGIAYPKSKRLWKSSMYFVNNSGFKANLFFSWVKRCCAKLKLLGRPELFLFHGSTAKWPSFRDIDVDTCLTAFRSPIYNALCFATSSNSRLYNVTNCCSISLQDDKKHNEFVVALSSPKGPNRIQPKTDLTANGWCLFPTLWSNGQWASGVSQPMRSSISESPTLNA